MKNITIQKIRIENFKGIKSLLLDFGGKDAVIAGYNATGKSTIVDAFSWLLWGKNAAGATRFDVRPRDKDRCEIHDIITTVEVTFCVENDSETPIEFTMRRDELEDLTKEQRAQLKTSDIANKKSFYFVDMAPYKAAQFSQAVAELLAPEEVFMLVSNPMAFFQLKEDKQRELLFGICGLVANEAVDGWQEVKNICGAVNTPEQTKEALEKQITACKRKAEEIPARIDSLSKLYDLQLDYNTEIADKEKELLNHTVKGKELSDEKETLIRSLGEKKKPQVPSDKAVRDMEFALHRAKNNVEVYQIRISDALAFKAKNTCPQCGFILQDTTQNIERAQKDMAEAQEKVTRLTEQLVVTQSEYDKAMEEYNALLAKWGDDSETLTKIQQIENELTDVLNKRSQCNAQISEYKQAQKAAVEVENLRKELREIDDSMANALTRLETVKDWIYCKYRQQMDNINNHFEKVKFTLYEMQANGSYKPCCKATIDGITYPNLNTAKKVYAGVEIAKLFAQSYGIKAPIFIDNTESIFDLPEINSQLIKLKADETCRKLQVQQL